MAQADSLPIVMSQGVKLPDRRYAVIVDEAHSSQTGESVKDLKTVLCANDDHVRPFGSECASDPP